MPRSRLSQVEVDQFVSDIAKADRTPPTREETMKVMCSLANLVWGEIAPDLDSTEAGGETEYTPSEMAALVLGEDRLTLHSFSTREIIAASRAINVQEVLTDYFS